MFELKLARLSGVLAFGLACALGIASCTAPGFSFSTSDAGAVLPHCQDAQVDDGESDVDCGGSCAPCALTQRCNVVEDCKDGTCTDGTCQAAGCTDGAQSGTETDVDCGGGACKPCAGGLGCSGGTDCASGVCAATLCAEPTCNDRVRNGNESDIDCGGPDCSACISGQGCLTPSDCVGGDCTSSKCALSCGAGLANCDGDAKNGCETNLRTDADHCGDCATPCSLSNATAACAGGVCKVDSCTAPFADCNGDPKDGCEVNTKTDGANCGACGTTCPGVNGAPFCADSACQITCTAGFADCDDKRENGCEKDVSHDVNNCGGCGIVCAPKAGGTAFCLNDQCGERVCPSGYGDCNGDPNDDAAHNGCETNLRTDVNNCKTCGNLCVAAGGTAQCSDTQCTIKACNTGLADCTGGYANGCETNTQTDVGNCGLCGKACVAANGASQCAGGMCQVKSCNSPNADCNLAVADGCEINTSTNQTNCGACSTAGGSNCNTYFGNAAGHCAGGTCAFDGCAADHANCDTDLSNGCEANLKGDKNHCGGCGISCAATNTTSTSCNAGTCAPTCAGTHITCGSPQNGCTIDSATDDGNCGGCGKTCDGSAGAHVTSNHCSSSACSPQCAPLFADCDTSRANGCEVPVGSDKINCGGCGVTCGTAHTTATACASGSCSPTCTAGWKNCGTPQQGCNTQLGTLTNCTACGEACGANGFCLSSGCSDHLDIGVVGSGVNAIMSFGTSGTPVLTKTHTLGTASGNSRIVLVGVTASEPYLKTESVKYNGTAMTAGPQINTNEMHSYAGIFYLLDAALPTDPGPYPVVVTYNGNPFAGVGTLDVQEFKNVQQTAPFVTTNAVQVNNDCAESGMGNRAVTLTFPQAQAGSYGYAVIGARGSSSASVSSPGGMTQTMNLRNGNDPVFLGVAGYAPIGNTTTFSWDITDCWNSANVAVALKRVGN